MHFGPMSLFPHTDAKTRKEKLEQVASFSLFGNVMSMASVQLVGASRDALLLSFKDAKVHLLICGFLVAGGIVWNLQPWSVYSH